MVDGVVATCKKTSRWCPTHPHRLQIICPKQPAVWFSDINQANTVIPLGQTPESFQSSTNNLTKLQNHHKSALSLTFDSGQCVVQITAFSYGTVSRDVSIFQLQILEDLPQCPGFPPPGVWGMTWIYIPPFAWSTELPSPPQAPVRGWEWSAHGSTTILILQNRNLQNETM